VKFRDFIKIIEDQRFKFDRQRGTSHRQYKGVVDGLARLVTVACTREGDDIAKGTLAAMIRQSGLPRKLFR
jgi:predicted RNA binding protein YcfA (HicA-like mRNA interferase family)